MFRRGSYRCLLVSGALATIAALGLAANVLPAAAKTPGTVYCFGGWCHRVSTVEEMDSIVGRRGFLKASYYDDCRRDRFNPCGLTSSGEVFNPDLPDNAASPIFPDGTIVLAYNPATQQAAVLRITSAGPYRHDRTLDVSRSAAEHLGFIKQGVAELAVAVLKSPNIEEARYRKMRTYAKVPGHMGRFSSLEAAEVAALEKLNMQTAPVRVADVRSRIDSWLPRDLAEDIREKAVIDVLEVTRPEAAITPAGAVSNAGPVAVVVANPQAGNSMMPPEPPEVRRKDVAESIQAEGGFNHFIDQVRAAARPRIRPALHAEAELQTNDSLLEKVASFIRAAQFHARIGAVSRNRIASLSSGERLTAEPARSQD